MARLARVVIPGLPHHITQRGNRRQPTFFGISDYEAYRELMNGHDDQLTKAAPLLNLTPAWAALLESGMSAEELEDFRRHDRTGRPLGDDGLLSGLERRLGRLLRHRKPGPKRTTKEHKGG